VTRDIPFPPAVGAALREWKPRCPSSRKDLVFPSGKGTVANQANIMNGHFRLMQIEAGVFTEIIEIKPNGKEATKKKAKYGLNALRHFCGNHTN
jgi:hypothetical protein